VLVKDEVKCEFEEDLTDETKYKQKLFGRLFTRSCARGTVFSIAECGCVIPEITHQKCLDGFKHNAKGECVDVDECVEFPGCCGEQSCRNTEGSYECYCEPGYKLNKNGSCVKVNCDLRSHPTEKTKYKQKHNRMWLIRSCAPGTEFSQSDCGCFLHVENKG